MTPLLLPRLDRDTALAELMRLNGTNAADLRAHCVRTTHPGQHWYPLGNRVDEQMLVNLRRELEALADGFGFPTALSTSRGGGGTGQADWDRQVGRVLADHLDVALFPGLEHPDVWTWVGLSLAPDLIGWRSGWPTINPDWTPARSRRAYERWVGTLRQGLRRPWYRTIQYADHGDLYPDLLEDHIVQIEERPSLGADPAVGRPLLDGIARAYVDGVLDETVRSKVREDAVRHAAKIILAEHTVLPLWARNPQDLETAMVHLIEEGAAIEQNRPTGRSRGPTADPKLQTATRSMPALLPEQGTVPPSAVESDPGMPVADPSTALSRWLARGRRRM